MAEWSNVLVLKTKVPKGTVGSNPTLSFKIYVVFNSNSTIIRIFKW